MSIVTFFALPRVLVRPAATGVLVGLLAAPVTAATLEAQYRVTLSGLSIGSARLSANVAETTYTVSVSAGLTGLVGAVAGGKGAAQANGLLAGGRALSNGFSLRAANSDMTRTVQIGASGGKVQSIVIDPPLDEKPDRVPVQEAHRQGVADPVGAMVMPRLAKEMADPKNCNRTLSVFDGSQRFDIALSFGGVQNVSAEEGYSGPAVVCKARYQPISGHRPGRKVTKFMVDNRDMEVWLAEIGPGGQFAPYRIAVKTMVGTAVIEANRFVVGTGAAAAR